MLGMLKNIFLELPNATTAPLWKCSSRKGSESVLDILGAFDEEVGSVLYSASLCVRTWYCVRPLSKSSSWVDTHSARSPSLSIIAGIGLVVILGHPRHHLPITSPSPPNHLPSPPHHLPITSPSPPNHLPITSPPSPHLLPITSPLPPNHLPITSPSPPHHLPITSPSPPHHLPSQSPPHHLPITSPSPPHHLPPQSPSPPSPPHHLPITPHHLPITSPSPPHHLPSSRYCC